MNPSNLINIQSNDSNGVGLIESSGLMKFRDTSRHHKCDVEEMLELVMFDKGTEEERQKMIDTDESVVNVYLDTRRSKDTWRHHIVSVASRMANISSS